jgi:hypothetical protein
MSPTAVLFASKERWNGLKNIHSSARLLGPSLLGLHARCFTSRCWPLLLRCAPAHRRGALFALMTNLVDEMGIGKAIQAISLILTARHLQPPGLAAPSSELAAVLARFPEPSAAAPSFAGLNAEPNAAGRLHPRPELPPTGASSAIPDRTVLPMPSSCRSRADLSMPLQMLEFVNRYAFTVHGRHNSIWPGYINLPNFPIFFKFGENH